MPPHQIRHLAARLFLAAFPGHYEELRQLLGHTLIATTMRYCGEAQEEVTRRYQEFALGRHRGGTSVPASPGPAARTRRGGRR